MEKKDVAILGASGATAFGWVAQTLAKRIYDGHPYFRLAALIADNPEHSGKPFQGMASNGGMWKRVFLRASPI